VTQATEKNKKTDEMKRDTGQPHPKCKDNENSTHGETIDETKCKGRLVRAEF